MDIGHRQIAEMADDIPVSRAGGRVASMRDDMKNVAELSRNEQAGCVVGHQADCVRDARGAVGEPEEAGRRERFDEPHDLNCEFAALDGSACRRRVEVDSVVTRGDDEAVVGKVRLPGRDRCLPCDEIRPFACRRIVSPEPCVPDSVKVGDKTVRHVWVAADEAHLSCDDLHVLLLSGMCLRRKPRGWILSSRLSPWCLVLSLAGTYDGNLGSCRNDVCVRFPLSKKKGEGDDCANRRARKFSWERQRHGRVAAGFGNNVNGMFRGFARFRIYRLPGRGNLVRGRRVDQVRSADRDLCRGKNLLVFGAAHALQMLNRCAGTRFINAVPVELARLAAKIRLDLGADMNLVIRSDHARFGVAFPRQHGVDAQPTIQRYVATILAERLHSFKKTAYDAEVRVELTSDNVAVVHGEAQTARGVVRFLVRDKKTENLLRRVAWINPGYHPVVEGRLGSRGYHGVCHNCIPSLMSPWVRCPMRFPATRPVPLSKLGNLPVGTMHIVSKMQYNAIYKSIR